MSDDYGGFSLFDLFAQETEAQASLLADGLLALERTPQAAPVLESCMRAAHSLKGAARIVGVAPGVAVAHVMEECFVLAQQRLIMLEAADIDVLLTAVDVLRSIADAGENASAPAAMQEVVARLESIAERGTPGGSKAPPAPASPAPASPATSEAFPELLLFPEPEAFTEPAAFPEPLLFPEPAAFLKPASPPEPEPRRDIARLPVPALQPTQPIQPPMAPQPVVAPQPTQTTQPPTAPQPVVAPQPTQTTQPPIAPQPVVAPQSTHPTQPIQPPLEPPPSQPSGAQPQPSTSAERTLRVSADNLDRLLALSGQGVVEARTLRPFTESVMTVLHRQREAGLALQSLRTRLLDENLPEDVHLAVEETSRRIDEVSEQLLERLSVLEAFDRRHLGLSNHLYEAALASRMRPFGDITGGYARMVREVARSLGKQVRLVIVGDMTLVDRDILSLLDAPLGHALRNAVDHGLETPDVRVAQGKPAEGRIVIEARHVAGTLVIDIEDDGRGIDVEAVRAAVIRRDLAKESVAQRLSEAELLEFLMLPGFSMREKVTEVSGRGVGLDVVQTTIRQVHGGMRLQQQQGGWTRLRMQLPLTLSVMRCLLADVGGEPYAFPLAHIQRAMRVAADSIQTIEGRAHFTLDGRSIALVLGSQVFRATAPEPSSDGMSVIIFGEANETYGLVVDRFRDERMLVVQPLDPRLGKLSDIAAASLMEDGSPVLIVDVEDLLRSMARLASASRVDVVPRMRTDAVQVRRKRVLVVDDSLTVRELQRKLLSNGGYDVSVAVDGMEGWNALMAERFDMVVTDVDMPRIDGIELVTMIRRDPEFRGLPVMIVSYKDRPADRQRGLDAGADHYLAKSSFHDAALLDAVRDLIGEATA